MFFDGRLAGCEVKWSKRMTLCEPLLKLRPRSDFVNTLLHEMIHAYVFVATSVRDHEDHGPLFQSHMNRINRAAQTKITVFHTFHDEVNSYRNHVWQCSGACRRKSPHFGLVKRSMNRAPGPTDRWWADHERNCGGSYSKIKEPKEFTAKQVKKREREKARDDKVKEKMGAVKAAPSVKDFFATLSGSFDGKNDFDKTTASSESAAPRTESKIPALPRNDRHKKRNRNYKNADWSRLKFPLPSPVVIPAGDDKVTSLFLRDIPALLQTPLVQMFSTYSQNQVGRNFATSVTEAKPGDSCPIVDLVTDSDESDSEQLKKAIKMSLVGHSQSIDKSLRTSRTGEENIIEIE
ncbi:hypothetical protein CCR75_000377 [Bremia lactucae]|uniref:SprT-like domain-containing protein n=1 Tax=Bremia lactucae TaxID=4779 RepID=A0A976FPJ6_BRELC|nr:hypothetical protein CCR75_000377 [Bremia lactucae]